MAVSVTGTPAAAHVAASPAPTLGSSSPFAMGQAPVSEPAGTEVPALRSATSRTYRLADGSLAARVWGNPVNYRDPHGVWQHIDNRLETVGAVLRNRANRYTAEIPVALGAGAVRLSEGDAWVSMTPLEAAGAARVSGHAASFTQAWPGVDATYEVVGDSIKETLMLGDATAARTFRFTIAAAGGLSARVTRAGAVELRDARGVIVWSFSAPVMVDAAGEAGNVAVGLERRAGGWELSLSASRSWLAAPERAWPVPIDPTVSPGPTADCLVSNETGMANNSSCAYSFLEAGWGHSTGTHDHHALLKFDVQSAVPAGADVLQARLFLYLTGEVGTASKQIFARRVTSAWDSSVSWNSRDGVNAWTTPGGDYASTCDDSAPTLNGSTDPGWKNWTIHDMVDGWSTGRYANHGVLLADDGSPVQAKALELLDVKLGT